MAKSDDSYSEQMSGLTWLTDFRVAVDWTVLERAQSGNMKKRQMRGLGPMRFAIFLRLTLSCPEQFQHWIDPWLLITRRLLFLHQLVVVSCISRLMSPVFMRSNKECDDYFGTMPKSNLVLQKSFKYLLSISVTVSACGLLSADGAVLDC